MTADSVRAVPYDGPCPKCGDNLTQSGPDRWCPTCHITVEAALEYCELQPPPRRRKKWWHSV